MQQDTQLQYFPELMQIKMAKIVLVPQGRNSNVIQVAEYLDTQDLGTAGEMSKKPEIFITSFIVNVVIKETQRDGLTSRILRPIQKEIIHEPNAKILGNITNPGSMFFDKGEEFLSLLDSSLEYFLYANKVKPLLDVNRVPVQQHVFSCLLPGQDPNYPVTEVEPILDLPYYGIIEEILTRPEVSDSVSVSNS
jgi:hypothetical protein